MTSLKNIILNRNYYRQAFIIVTIIFTISVFGKLSTPLNFILLLWGSILIFHDLITKRIIFSSRRYIPLFIFMALYAVTLFINRDMNLFSNIKIFFLTGLQFFVLFAFDREKSVEKSVKSMEKFNSTIIFMTIISTSVSLLTFLLNINIDFGDFFIGSSNGMLAGIYVGANTAGPVAAVSFAVTIINYELRGEQRFKKIEIANMIIQVIFIYLTNSRATIYSLMVFVVLIAIFVPRNIKAKGIGLVGAAAIYFGGSLVKPVMQFIQKGGIYLKHLGEYAYISVIGAAEEIQIEDIPIEETGLIDKDISMGFLNGRGQLWKCGMQMIKDNPWFGVGSRNTADVAFKYASYDELPGITGGGMHNIIIQVLVSNGILGFAALFVFIIMCFIDFVKYFVKNRMQGRYSRAVLMSGALVLMLLVNNMAEANILFAASYMATVFWTYLGFGILLIDKDKDVYGR